MSDYDFLHPKDLRAQPAAPSDEVAAVLRYCRAVQQEGTVNERVVAQTVARMLVQPEAAEPKGADGLPVSAPRLYADEEPPGHADHVPKARNLFDAAPPVAPEPVAWTTLIEIDWVKRNAGRAGSFYAVKAGPNDIPLFAHPPRAPLTDAGIERAYRESQGQDLRPQDRKRVIDFARAVLAADHGIRGQG